MNRRELADGLIRARERTLALVDFDDDELHRQYHPLMSPLVWDLAHIGQQEELWLLRGGDLEVPGLLAPNVENLYDAFEHSRASRVDLPLMSPKQAHSYLNTVRDRAFDALDALHDEDPGFVFGLVVSHENQHGETMLQALNLRAGAPILDAGARLPQGGPTSQAAMLWCRVDLSCSVSTRRANRTPWTTSVRRTSSTSRPSGSAGCR